MSPETVVEVGEPRERLFTREFVILLITQSCFGMAFSALFLLPKYMKLALAADDMSVGVMQSCGALAGVLAFPVVGRLNDRYGRKPFVVAGSVLMTLTALGMLAHRELDLGLFLLRATQGAAFALLFNSAATLAAESVSPRLLGRTLSVLGASMLATNALSPALVEPVTRAFGWVWLFRMSLGWGVLSVLLALFVREKKARRVVGAGSASALSLLGSPRGLSIAFTMAATGAGFGSVFTFHQPYALSLGMERVSGFFVSYAACALVMRLFLMEYVDRFGRLRVSGLSVLVYALGVALTAFMGPDVLPWVPDRFRGHPWPGMLEVVGAVMGLAQGLFYPMFNALAIETAVPEQRGSMMALYHGSFNAGMAALLLLGGGIAQRFGYPALFFVTAAWTALAGVVLLRTRVFDTAVPEAA